MVQAKGDVAQISERLKSYAGVLSVKYTARPDGVGEWVVTSDGSMDLRSQITKGISQQFDLLEVKTLRLSLEDIFVKLVTREKEGV